MEYQEFKKEYKWTLKNYPETSNLYGDRYKIEMTESHFEKVGNRWKETETKKKNITYINYFNILDSIPFFKNLGGREIVKSCYTFAGYIPYEINSISPTRTEKTVRHFKILQA